MTPHGPGNTPRPARRLSQRTAIAVIAVATAVAAATIWHWPSAGRKAGEAAGAHGQGEDHGDHGHHDDQDDQDGSGPRTQSQRAHAGPPMVHLSAAQIQALGLRTAQAGPASVRASLALPGEVQLDADQTAQVVPAAPGVVEQVVAAPGQAVRRGEVLAVMSSAEVAGWRADLLTARQRVASAQETFEREQALWKRGISARQEAQQAEQALREAQIAHGQAQARVQLLGAGAARDGEGGATARYALRAPLDGMVVSRDAVRGQRRGAETPAFVIADLRTLWVEVALAAAQLGRVRVGMAATVQSADTAQSASGRVVEIGPLLGKHTRAATARLVVDNPSQAWRPGLLVTVSLEHGRAEVPVAVAAAAVTTFEDRAVVFVRHAQGFEARPVTVGRRDHEHVEIVQGLKAGEAYAPDPVLLKAELAKGSAEHSH